MAWWSDKKETYHRDVAAERKELARERAREAKELKKQKAEEKREIALQKKQEKEEARNKGEKELGFYKGYRIYKIGDYIFSDVADTYGSKHKWLTLTAAKKWIDWYINKTQSNPGKLKLKKGVRGLVRLEGRGRSSRLVIYT